MRTQKRAYAPIFDLPGQIKAKLARNNTLADGEKKLLRRCIQAHTERAVFILSSIVELSRHADVNRSELAAWLERIPAEGAGTPRLLPYDIRVIDRWVAAGLVYEKKRLSKSGKGGEIQYSVPEAVRLVVDEIEKETVDRANRALTEKNRFNQA